MKYQNFSVYNGHYLETVNRYVIIRGEGGCLRLITLNVKFVSNTTTVKVITGKGVSIWPKIYYVICERSFTAIV